MYLPFYKVDLIQTTSRLRSDLLQSLRRMKHNDRQTNKRVSPGRKIPLHAQAAERDRAMRVGGLLKPSEMDQEDELWLDLELRSELPVSSLDRATKDLAELVTPEDGLNGWSLYGFQA